MTDLASRSCVPCRGGVPPLQGEELASLIAQLPGSWETIEDHHLRAEFAFPDFVQALAFTNQIGDLAEAQGHHPDLHLSWGRVVVEIWTHKIDGLTESDFILAAKIESLYGR